jgi:hypothetical protein
VIGVSRRTPRPLLRTRPSLLVACALGLVPPGALRAQGPCTGNAVATATALYVRILHRKPTRLELRRTVRLLSHGRLVVELVHSVALSAEHRDSLARLTPDQVVERLYRDLLDRSVDSAGRAQWLPAYAAGGLNSVVHGIQYTPEYQQKWGAARVPGTEVAFACARDAMPMAPNH